MQIRPAERLDVPELLEAIRSLVDDVDDDKTRYILDALTEDPVNDSLLFLVAERDGQVIGSVMMERVQDLWTQRYIVAKRFFYVLPEYRATRVGAKFLQRVLQWAEEVPSIMRVELDDAAVEALGPGLHKRGYKRVSAVYGLGGT